jgi:tRNA dimethylallyltransferase
MVPALLEEVEGLLASGLSPRAPAMSALGYRDAVAVVTGEAPRAGLQERLAAAHRQYAKRQRTWLRGMDAALRIEVLDEAAIERAAGALREWFS